MNDSANIVAATRKELFSVECTTCKARLKVRSMAAIGQILACPKCNSMVLVAPPADWHAEGTAPPVASVPADSETTAGSGNAKFVWKLAAAAGAATLVCGLAVFAIWRMFPTPAPTVTVAEAPDPVVLEATPEPEAVATTAEAEPAVASETPPVSVEAEAPSPVVETPVEEPAVVETPAEPPVPAPATEAVAVDPPVEPTPPPVDPAPSPPPQVAEASTADDLLRKLRTSVAGIDEPSIRLDALAQLLGGLAACPITLDVTSLEAADLSGETATTVKVEDASVETALRSALEPLGLDFEARGKAIVIFAPEK